MERETRVQHFPLNLIGFLAHSYPVQQLHTHSGECVGLHPLLARAQTRRVFNGGDPLFRKYASEGLQERLMARTLEFER